MRLAGKKWYFRFGRGQHPVLVFDAVGIGHPKYFASIAGSRLKILNIIRASGATYIGEEDEYNKLARYLRTVLNDSPNKLLISMKKCDQVVKSLNGKTEK